MIIVSQDKYNLLNFDTTVNIGVEDERTRIKLMMEGVLLYEMPKE